MKNLGIGIIGFGRIGNEHAGWLKNAAGIRAVAASGPTAPRRAVIRRFRSGNSPSS